ncbi:hypothetical protein DPEC_G00024350 [Dallia pectoralis]|uniref:Uncharacterized protein n=1 Tax=Dallia pectoralis TaxID=75939 RepID=A0ACC2HHM7_DALPE|nr:hypothetical protein DPEC_G00024350 [Dallia pectoralis]
MDAVTGKANGGPDNGLSAGLDQGEGSSPGPLLPSTSPHPDRPATRLTTKEGQLNQPQHLEPLAARAQPRREGRG